MNIIIVSLERAKERRERIEKQLKDLNIDAVIYNCFDTADIKNPTFGAKFSLEGGYRFGEPMRGGELCCGISHITALNIAKALNWEYAIILEDDVILAQDFEKRIKILLKMLPKDWEHVYISGIPFFKDFFLKTNFVQLLPATTDKISRVDTTCAYMVNRSAYDKLIKKLMTLKTTPDDLINDIIFKEKKLKSYLYLPFPVYVEDNFTYIWDFKLERKHKSAELYLDKI